MRRTKHLYEGEFKLDPCKSRVYLSKRSWKKPDWNWLGTVGVKLTSCCEGWHPLNGGSGLVSCLAGQGHSLGELEPVCSMVIFYP
jgi:hypothetical protein